MRSKEEAFAFAVGQLNVRTLHKDKHDKFHYGKIDISELLDFIYDEQCTEEGELPD